MVKKMKYNEQALQFWTQNKKVMHIIPPSSTSDFPEGWDVQTFLKTIIGDESVVEVGCGYGRLVDKFDPSQYKGVDINPSAVAMAQERHPEYQFSVYTLGDNLPTSDWLLLYTVLLHVSNDDIADFLGQITSNCSKVIISEIMYQSPGKPPRPGKPPVWNRTEETYVSLLGAVGFHLTSSVKNSWRDVENRITTLTFEKK